MALFHYVPGRDRGSCWRMGTEDAEMPNVATFRRERVPGRMGGTFTTERVPRTPLSRPIKYRV